MMDVIGRGCSTCHGEYGAHRYWCDEPRRQEERVSRMVNALICSPESSDWMSFFERRELALRKRSNKRWPEEP